MSYVIQGRLFLVNSTTTYTAAFQMAGLNAVLAQLQFPVVTGSCTLEAYFEVSNDGSAWTQIVSVTGIAVAVNVPKTADSGTNAIGGIWCRIGLKLSAGTSAEVILDVNTYSR